MMSTLLSVGIIFFTFSFTVLKLTTKRRLIRGVAPSIIYAALMNHTIESCRTAALLHFPGTYPLDSHLKYSDNKDVWVVIFILVVATDIKSTRPAKIERDNTSINFFSAVLSNGVCWSYSNLCFLCVSKNQVTHFVLWYYVTLTFQIIIIKRIVEMSRTTVITRVIEYVDRSLFLEKHRGTKKRLIEYLLLSTAKAVITAGSGARKPV